MYLSDRDINLLDKEESPYYNQPSNKSGKALAIVTLALGISSLLLIALGFLIPVGGFIGEIIYLIAFKANLKFYFWKVGAFANFLFYAAALPRSIVGIIIGARAINEGKKQIMAGIGMLLCIFSAVGFVTFIPTLTLIVYGILFLFSLPFMLIPLF